ncbi:amidohydrolase family protein [Maribacter antarcticus]|uniref:amidohydrolase family protein n=1 Tax=Maribacter antarcticus TaxID=505250 RepID=UPI0004793E33|nr:amidohydrolase family protein [Maribacter antarcticus]
MKIVLKFIGIGVGILLLIGVTSYLFWFHNTEEHVLKLKPSEVYSPNKSNSYLITNANIIDVEAGVVLKNKHLIIQNGVFKQIFEGQVSDSLKTIYKVIDAKNRYLMPGMIDMHTHLNSGGLIPPDKTTRPMALEQFARYGVSTIFTLGGHGFNQEITAELIQKQQKHEIVAPMILATGSILTAPGGYPIPFVSSMTGLSEDEIHLNEQGIFTITEETDLDVIFSKKQELGLNGVKVMVESGLGGASEEPRLSNKLTGKIIQKASQYKLPVFAHVTRKADLQDAVNAGADVIAHTIEDQLLTGAEPFLEKMIRDSISYTPTLSVAYIFQYISSAKILEDPFMMQYSSERTNRSLENWPVRQMMVRSYGIDIDLHKENNIKNFTTMYKAGVNILMGSDAGNPSIIPGYSAHKELVFMSEAGMTNAEVLRSATIAPAKFLKMEDKIGSIKEGKIASFLILDKNPLDAIKNSQTIYKVMLEGYWIE